MCQEFKLILKIQESEMVLKEQVVSIKLFFLDSSEIDHINIARIT